MSNQTTVKIDLTISLQTPLSVGAAGSRGGLADKSIMRDGWNRPLIPGSQIKGRIRHACERIAHALGCPICRAPVAETMCPDSSNLIERLATEKRHRQRAKEQDKKARQCVVCAIFGSSLYPSRLIFTNAVQVLEETPKVPLPLNDPLRTGVGLDRRRRIALEQVLYVTETTKNGLQFKSTIYGAWRETELAEVKELMGLLMAGIRFTTRWGGGGSRGLGWADVTSEVYINDEEQNFTDLLKGVEALCPTAS